MTLPLDQDRMDFKRLVDAIRQVHDDLAAQASRAVNVSLTLRNWLIGCYIAEYELNGADRAAYGEKVLSELAKQLSDISNCNRRQLYRYMRFYRLYPQIVGTLSPQFQRLLPAFVFPAKVGTPSPQSAPQGLALPEGSRTAILSSWSILKTTPGAPSIRHNNRRCSRISSSIV
ncbi:hypothetical protein Thiowin_03325 [Thiorhodovibrio winogradskyi]|uniref:YhcG N-terminal domain-containing protein n=1 Tax=Thiorhodovibrio winogradskyi TaxID=77007 RepID=A0ABZ0SB63_9GAMM|nr:DUF1016 N-terminal domain-containing protein [Thiorhodovibrio winogradskyi]